jgi:hypothetical protein
MIDPNPDLDPDSDLDSNLDPKLMTKPDPDPQQCLEEVRTKR